MNPIPSRWSTLRNRRIICQAVAASAVLMGCTPPATPDPEGIRVVTYNIRHGRGMDEEVDLERTARVLGELRPRLIGLQEVDHRAERSGGVAQADSLGRLIGMEAVFGAFMPYQGGEYGMAILTDLPLARSWSIPLPPGGSEPRVALAAMVVLPGQDTVVAVNVHFDWVRDDGFRFAQALSLTEVLDTLSHPWILLGDLNDTPDSPTVQLFRDRGVEARKPEGGSFTFPSPEPVREIDYIFAFPTGGWRVADVRVVPEVEASDHRPVAATLRRSSGSPSP